MPSNTIHKHLNQRKMTIEDKNIVIAEFMGMSQTKVKIVELNINSTIWELPTEDQNFSFLSRHEHLLFDTDYNWLMKAWVKFRDLNLYNYDYMQLKNTFLNILAFRTISEAFEALYEAVNWLNSLKK